MDQALLLIQAYQSWAYLILGFGCLLALRRAGVWWRTLRAAEFGLERERARRSLTRALTLAAWLLATAAVTFGLATFVAPSVPAPERLGPPPTISLLATPATPPPDGAAATALPQSALDPAGCANPLASLTFPEDGAELVGRVTIEGSAAIPNFAFFKYEYVELAAGSPAPGAIWRAISAGTTPVTAGELGLWDTTLVTPGEYAFRLVVTDTTGNAPMPCVRRVRVLPGG